MLFTGALVEPSLEGQNTRKVYSLNIHNKIMAEYVHTKLICSYNARTHMHSLCFIIEIPEVLAKFGNASPD